MNSIYSMNQRYPEWIGYPDQTSGNAIRERCYPNMIYICARICPKLEKSFHLRSLENPEKRPKSRKLRQWKLWQIDRSSVPITWNPGIVASIMAPFWFRSEFKALHNSTSVWWQICAPGLNWPWQERLEISGDEIKVKTIEEIKWKQLKK